MKILYKKVALVVSISVLAILFVAMLMISNSRLKEQQKELLGRTAVVSVLHKGWPMLTLQMSNGGKKKEVFAPGSTGLAIGDKVRITGFDTVGYPLATKL